MINFTLRPFQEEDRAPLLAIGNRDRPAHRRGTAEGWARNDARRKPEQVFLRLVAPHPETGEAIAWMEVDDLNTTGFKLEDVCEMSLLVGHDFRRRGLGALLYDRALAFANERGAKRLLAGFHERTPDEPALGFLTRRGFTEQERETPSFLDLTQWDATPHAASLAQADAYGAEIFTLADVGDTDENRRLYYDLEKPLIYDIPRRDQQPFTFEPYPDWVKFVIDRPEWRPELVILAARDGHWIGECHVVPKLEAPHIGMQWLTGVLNGHRGHGLATALKVRAYEAARAAGVTIMTTENHEDNAPMLAINRKFGFQPEPADVVYNKVLESKVLDAAP